MTNVNFTGIKLYNTKLESVRDIVYHLERCGFYSYGKRECKAGLTFDSKRKLFRNLRNENPFVYKDFGTVFLPNSKEVYIISNLDNEQRMLPYVQDLDKYACINLLI